MEVPLDEQTDPPHWSEETSRLFLDYGRVFVPDREEQIACLAALVPAAEGPFTVLELACGEGLLAEAILEKHPAATVIGLDGSAEMLRQAARRLGRFGERFAGRRFELAADDWRRPAPGLRAVVSSLTIHHLEGPEKRRLFRDVRAMLPEGGLFAVADVVAAAHEGGRALAAAAWDEAVRRRSLALTGDLEAFDRFVTERWNMFRWLDPEDIDKPSRLADQLRWLEEAGFSDVDVHWMLAGHAVFSGVSRGR
jgi:tRNA (cmo5U34)-methyltransferase